MKSLFTAHNELVNVWTHLIGALIVIAIVIYITFSFNTSSRDKIKKEIRSLVNPLINEVKNFDYHKNWDLVV